MMGQQHGYSDRVAIVTGGASGIGRAISQELLRKGAWVVVADRQSGAALAWFSDASERAWARGLDVTRSGELRDLVREVVDRHGRIDYLFNNAGVAPVGGFAEETEATWDTAVGTNLLGVLYGSAAVYPQMIRQGSGHMVNMASLSGLIPVPGMATYSATKSGVIGFSLALRAEARRSGVRVSVACPALVSTELRRTTATALDRPPRTRADPWFVRRLSAEECARRILRGVAANQALIVVPAWARLAWIAYRLLPGLYYAAVAPRLAAFVVPRPD